MDMKGIPQWFVGLVLGIALLTPQTTYAQSISSNPAEGLVRTIDLETNAFIWVPQSRWDQWHAPRPAWDMDSLLDQKTRAFVDALNQNRAQVGAPPLEFLPKYSARSLRWTNRYLIKQDFAHAAQTKNRFEVLHDPYAIHTNKTDDFHFLANSFWTYDSGDPFLISMRNMISYDAAMDPETKRIAVSMLYDPEHNLFYAAYVLSTKD